MGNMEIWEGSSGRCWPRMLKGIQSQIHAGERVVVLVPEQITLQCERDLVEDLHLPGLLDVEVLSPSRLQHRIREMGGHSPMLPLDDRGRSLVLAHAMTECRSELTYYQKAADRGSLPEQLSRLVLDLQRVDMTPDQLRAYSRQLAGAEQAKFADIARIWETAEELMEGRFLDDQAYHQDLIAHLRPSHVLQGVHLWVYGFDALPLPTCRLLAEAAEETASLRMVWIMAREGGASDSRLFASQWRTALEWQEMIREKGMRCQWVKLDAEEPLRRAPALRHLERHLFSMDTLTPWQEPTDALRLVSAEDPYEEALSAAHQLWQWHRAGIAWEEMRVLLGDASALPGILADLLPQAGIPVYVSRQEKATRLGLCQMLTASLRAASMGYPANEVLTVAKSGFSGLTWEEAARLENYAFTHGIRYQKWLKPFADEEIEPLRERLMAPLQRLRERLAEAEDASDSVSAVYLLLEETDAYNRLREREERLLQAGMPTQAEQERQIWRVVMELLDQLWVLLRGKKVRMTDIARYVESGLDAVTLHTLPPQPGQVVVTTAEAWTDGTVRALLIMGVQDGVLNAPEDAVLSERERAELTEQAGQQVGTAQTERQAIRQSTFFRAATAPTEYLTISWSETGLDGSAQREALLIHELRRMFPGLEAEDGQGAETPLSPYLGMEQTADWLRCLERGEEVPKEWARVLRSLWRHPEWHDRTAALLRPILGTELPEEVAPELITRLTAQERTSITRLECWAECPYHYWLEHVLRPVPRQPYEFAANEKGTFYHAAMEQFAVRAAAAPGWPDWTREQVDDLLRGILPELTRDWQGGPLTEDPLGVFSGEQYQRAVERAAWNYTCQAQQSAFRPLGAEWRFGEPDPDSLPGVLLHLPDGNRISLRGRIDRLDTWISPEGVQYQRVVDLKSSKHTLTPAEINAGMQLQLLLYLRAAERIPGGASPAGAYYYQIADPRCDIPGLSPEEADEEIAKSFRLSGLTLADEDVVRAMDRSQYSLPSLFKQDHTLRESAAACDAEQMQDLIALTTRRAENIAWEIRQGHFPVQPRTTAKPGEVITACRYCPHAAACGYEGRGVSVRKMKMEELLDIAARENHP